MDPESEEKEIRDRAEEMFRVALEAHRYDAKAALMERCLAEAKRLQHEEKMKRLW